MKKDDKKTLSVQLHPAMATAIMSVVANWRRRLPPAARAALAPRDGRSAYSHALERALAWLLELSDGDFDRIQAEGAEIVGRSPLRRKTHSVFRTGAAADSARPMPSEVRGRHIGGSHPTHGTAGPVGEPSTQQQPMRPADLISPAPSSILARPWPLLPEHLA